MRNKIFAILFILLSGFSFEQRTICIKGIVKDENGLPLENATVTLWANYTSSDFITGKKGNFIFQNIGITDHFIIGAGKEQYLSRHSYYREDTTQIGDSIFISITLRSRKSATINTSHISKKDLGISLGDAILKFKLDTSECSLQTEPYGIARGLKTELSDSTFLYLQIERTGNNFYFKPLYNEKIIGIGLAYPDCTTKTFGEGFVWWGIMNPYCKQ